MSLKCTASPGGSASQSRSCSFVSKCLFCKSLLLLCSQQCLRSCWGVFLYFPLPANWRFRYYPCKFWSLSKWANRGGSMETSLKWTLLFWKKNAILFHFLFMVLLLESPTHLGRSVTQCLVLRSYRHGKWADSTTCHLLLSKWSVIAMWLHRAGVDAEHPIPKPCSAREQQGLQGGDAFWGSYCVVYLWWLWMLSLLKFMTVFLVNLSLWYVQNQDLILVY